ncbi:MAG: hypothetical protein M1835_003572 [Candelina submexicana]|nr:MAG: hypothetical protein M1835_003572 [Candelina submexicana]
MATTGKDSFSDLERHRLRLEESISKLRKALQHWQTWEAEYEGLKEEILASESQGNNAEVEAVGADFGGTLVTHKEIEELSKDKNGTTRSSKQVVDLLSKRIDYVEQSITTIQKQLAVAEEKLSALLVLQQPEVHNEEGLPVTEIREELDEDGNIIASTTSVPSEASSQVIKALQKAGVKELEDLQKDSLNGVRAQAGIEAVEEVLDNNTDCDQETTTLVTNGTNSQTITNSSSLKEGSSTAAEGLSAKYASALPNQGSVRATSTTELNGKRPRKSVTFAEDTKEEHLVSSKRSFLGPPQRIAKPTPSINSGIEDISESSDLTTAIVPDNESPEDAQLRKEMLQYGLSEVSAVVAELALEESGSETSYSDNEYTEEEGEEEYSSSVEEEEDKYGRSIRREVTDDYRREMRELEMRLSARAMENVGPGTGPSGNGADDATHDVKQIVVDFSDSGDQPEKRLNGSAKKGVRFAQELDISPAPERKMEYSSLSSDSKAAVPAINEAVIERRSLVAEPSSASPASAITPRKASRFKSARNKAETTAEGSRVLDAISPQVAIHTEPIKEDLPRRGSALKGSLPSYIAASGDIISPESDADSLRSAEHIQQTSKGPPGKTLSNEIIERPSTLPKRIAPEPDDLDPALQHQQIVTEYHRMRNRMIQREGGFKAREDEEIVPLTEEEGGSGKKISRFKAAKLGRAAT